MKKVPKEEQYQFMVDLRDSRGLVPMSIRASTMWRTDPKLLLFTLSRHKFVAKMLAGKEKVLEVGCGDAFASRLLHPEVGELHSIDFDPLFIQDAKNRGEPDWPAKYEVHDIIRDGPYRKKGLFDAAFSLDVIEHIPKKNEGIFFRNICRSLRPDGVFICGSPSLESQLYASEGSRRGHVNCKKGADLKQAALKHFENVFLFGMNDEVLHTGFAPMCHYLFVLAVGVRR